MTRSLPACAFPALVDEATDVPPGSDGVLFLPYLSGERTPYPDPRARGAFVGLASQHGRPHMTRAVLEGVAFGLKDSLELMRDVGVTGFDEIRATGGGSASELWRGILADVLEMPVVTTTTSEGAAQGAAMLAATGGGWFANMEDACRALVTLDGRVDPSPSDVYRERYTQYRALYPALAPTFHSLS